MTDETTGPAPRSHIPHVITGPAGPDGQLLVVWLEVPSGGGSN